MFVAAVLMMIGWLCVADSPVLIHSNVGDLLHSLDSPGPKMYNSPKLVALNREGNIVVSYEKGGICLFTVNGKLLCDISHSESVQVLLQCCLAVCSGIHLVTNSFFQRVIMANDAWICHCCFFTQLVMMP